MLNIPLTEATNTKSTNIDLLNTHDAINVLFECEYEIFWNEYWKWILEASFLSKLASIKASIDSLSDLQEEWFIILVWAGTSWRLCKMMADIYNNNKQLNTNIKVIPLLSGWSDSLIKAQINAEDNWDNGYIDMKNILWTLNASNVIVIWITCWLSSSYVAGSLEAGLFYWSKNVAVIWFNRREDATMQFKDDKLIDEVIKLNPIIWPEAIRWSVRMKWWTATIMILNILLLSELKKEHNTVNEIQDLFYGIKNEYDVFYNQIENSDLKLFEKWANALRRWWRIYYIANWYTSYLCLFDTVECFPTFGADSWQINVFINWGINSFSLFSYDDFKNTYELDLEYFTKNIVLTDNDLCIISWIDSTDEIIRKLSNPDNVINLQSLKISTEIDKGLLFYRTLLSCFSTYSFIQVWKIYWNMMIDVKITNKKLYSRACRIIAEILNIDLPNVERQIIKIINVRCDKDYMKNQNNIEKIIESSSTIKNIVAKTIISYHYPSKTKLEIENMISNEPIIRKLIFDVIK